MTSDKQGSSSFARSRSIAGTNSSTHVKPRIPAFTIDSKGSFVSSIESEDDFFVNEELVVVNNEIGGNCVSPTCMRDADTKDISLNISDSIGHIERDNMKISAGMDGHSWDVPNENYPATPELQFSANRPILGRF